MIRWILATTAAVLAAALPGLTFDGRPHAWCGWYMRHIVHRDPGPDFNRAAEWVRWGQPSGPQAGAVVVWPHHVGMIVGRDRNGQWLVHSGNDSNMVRTRPRSLAGAIAFRRDISIPTIRTASSSVSDAPTATYQVASFESKPYRRISSRHHHIHYQHFAKRQKLPEHEEAAKPPTHEDASLPFLFKHNHLINASLEQESDEEPTISTKHLHRYRRSTPPPNSTPTPWNNGPLSPFLAAVFN